MASETPQTDAPPGTGADLNSVSGWAAFAEAAATVAAQAQRQLRIISHGLESQAYASQDFVEAARQLAITNPRAEIRILLHSIVPSVHASHRLLTTANNLTSFFEVRKLTDKQKEHEYDAVIADTRAVLIRLRPNALSAQHFPDAPMIARREVERFDELWEQAEVASELRNLHL